MKISLLGLCLCLLTAALAFVGPEAPPAPEADELLEQVRVAYADLEAYSDVARVELAYDPVGQLHHLVRQGLEEKQGEMELLFARGGGFLLDNKLEADARLVAWDGQTLGIAFDRFRRYAIEAREAAPTSELLPPFVFNAAFESHPIAAILLHPQRELPAVFDGMDEIGQPEAETLKGREGWRLPFKVITQGHEDLPPTEASLWIGRDDHLIHEIRLDQTRAQNAFAQRTGESPYKSFVVTVTFLQVHVNPQIERQSFAFEPPEGYERMAMPATRP